MGILCGSDWTGCEVAPLEVDELGGRRPDPGRPSGSACISALISPSLV